LAVATEAFVMAMSLAALRLLLKPSGPLVRHAQQGFPRAFVGLPVQRVEQAVLSIRNSTMAMVRCGASIAVAANQRSQLGSPFVRVRMNLPYERE
jgi:hypothetical protein